MQSCRRFRFRYWHCINIAAESIARRSIERATEQQRLNLAGEYQPLPQPQQQLMRTPFFAGRQRLSNGLPFINQDKRRRGINYKGLFRPSPSMLPN
jgi:hypothetical protein